MSISNITFAILDKTILLCEIILLEILLVMQIFTISGIYYYANIFYSIIYGINVNVDKFA